MGRGKSMKNSFLTERQYEILKFRKQGLSSEEISGILHVTRQDISVLERRIRDNVDRALNTISLVKEMDYLTVIRIEKGTNFIEASNQVFEAADKAGIRLNENYISLATMIRSAFPSGVHKGILESPLSVYLRKNGGILMMHEE